MTPQEKRTYNAINRKRIAWFTPKVRGNWTYFASRTVVLGDLVTRDFVKVRGTVTEVRARLAKIAIAEGAVVSEWTVTGV